MLSKVASEGRTDEEALATMLELQAYCCLRMAPAVSTHTHVYDPSLSNQPLLEEGDPWKTRPRVCPERRQGRRQGYGRCQLLRD